LTFHCSPRDANQPRRSAYGCRNEDDVSLGVVLVDAAQVQLDQTPLGVEGAVEVTAEVDRLRCRGGGCVPLVGSGTAPGACGIRIVVV
jgi:hypothetical protein